MNKYYIIETSDENLSKLLHCAVGSVDTQRYSLDKSKVVLKTPIDYRKDCPLYSKYSPIELEDLYVILNGPEWSNNDDNITTT